MDRRRDLMLEDLRVADRLLADAQKRFEATLQQRRSVWMRACLPTFLVFDPETRADNERAGALVLEAAALLRKTASPQELDAEPTIVSWGAAGTALTEVFDIVAQTKIRQNLQTTTRLHRAVRRAYEDLRTEGGRALAPELPDWSDGPTGLRTAWQYNKAAFVAIGAGVLTLVALIVAYAVLS